MLILASSSPRRRDLLRRLGVPFQVVPSEASESIDPTRPPAEKAVGLAKRKARTVAAQRDSGLVLGADTFVVLHGEVLGKPRDDEDAFSMLLALSGQVHTVVTGVALIVVGSTLEGASAISTSVRFRVLSEDEIARYIASGEPRDKAGAYAIQGLGSALIAGFDGCFTNVVGLPLCETSRLLANSGVALPMAEPVCRLPNGAACPRLV